MTRVGAWLLVPGLVLGCLGCRQDMHDQPKYRPLRPSPLFSDRRSARPLPPGTIPQGGLQEDVEYYTGKIAPRPGAMRQVSAAGAEDPYADFVKEFPIPITREVLERGRERFNFFCTPCHGYTGAGNGMIVQRGLSKPPSFHDPRLQQAPVGHYFDVITNGFGAMYSYAQRIPVRDRWAIIAYIRALQLSQSATVADVPPNVRARLEQAAAEEKIEEPSSGRPE